MNHGDTALINIQISINANVTSHAIIFLNNYDDLSVFACCCCCLFVCLFVCSFFSFWQACPFWISLLVQHLSNMLNLYIPEVMKTGSANLNFLCNFSQLPLSNISLFTVLFTAYAGFFRFFLACFLVRDMFSSGCRINYPPPPRPTRPVPPLCFLFGGGILNGKRL